MVVTISSNENTIEWGATGVDRIIQNARNIIRTRKYEVPFLRHMGITPDIIDASVQTLKSDIAAEVTDALNAYEERVTVLDVLLDSVDANGDYIIVVKLEV